MGTRLYVGNLPYSADGAQLAHIFSSYGEVVEARVISDRDSGQSKGFGFVEMGSESAAQGAIAGLNGSALEDRALRVSMATERPTGGSQERSGRRSRALLRPYAEHLGQVAAVRCLAAREDLNLSTDMTLQCRECGQAFQFTAGEQEFYASRGLTNQPSRCPDCRAARKASGGGSSGGYASDRGARQMYTATCAGCGQQTSVPFQPRGDKPVYCSNCFQRHGGGSRDDGRGISGRRF
jgi:CxxC-x17-CxxC domain-containing protein